MSVPVTRDPGHRSLESHRSSQNSQWPFTQLSYTITNLAINKLGLVPMLVELIIPSRHIEVSPTAHTERSADAREGGYK